MVTKFNNKNLKIRILSSVIKKNKILFLLLAFSCSSMNDKLIKEDSLAIIKQEINRYENYYSKDKISLKLKSTDFLISFIIENSHDNTLYSSNIKNKIGQKLYKQIFNPKKIEFYKKQKNNNLPLSEIKLPKRIVLVNNSKDSIQVNDLQRILGYSKVYLYLSNPIYTEDGSYCLISSSIGTHNETSGYINLYKKENNKWVLFKILDGWI